MSDDAGPVSVEPEKDPRVCPADLRLEYLEPDDPRLAEASVLRNDVLIVPFGLPPIAWDDDSLATVRLAAFLGTRMVGFASLFAGADFAEQRMRQVTVAFDLQGCGIGRALVLELTEECRRRGVRRLWLAARLSAIPFYERLGFEVIGDEYVETAVGLPHRHMELPGL